MRRTMAAFASIALAAGTIALATPAQAATISITVDCSTSSTTTNPSGFQDGDLVEFTIGATCTRVDVEKTLVSASSDVTVTGTLASGPTDTGTNFRYQWIAANVTQVDVQTLGSIPSISAVSFIGSGGTPATVTYNFGPIPGPGPGPSPSPGSDSSGGSAPVPVMQQFGLPASGNCEDGYSDSMNWSGVGNGGWGISWAQWVNDGAGGAVCSRTVMYDASTAKWIVS